MRREGGSTTLGYRERRLGDEMPLLRNIMFQAARRLAQDPRMRQKAGEVYQDSVAPRLSAARDELRDLSSEVSPTKDPKGFARALGRRIAEINKSQDR